MDLKSWVIELRRDFHRFPETGFNEVRTSARVEEILRSLDIEVRRPVGTAVVGILRGGAPGKTVALRADMDALEIQEVSKVSYASQNPGVMHACGHDAHTASLLGAARVLAESRETLKGTVVFLFQPAEESLGGAQSMVNAGVLEGVDAVFGTHVFPQFPAGIYGVVSGPMLAGSASFRIDFKGSGGHGAMPHHAVDALAPACATYSGLQTILTKEMDASDAIVLNIGQLHAGTRLNIVPGEAWMDGTVRYFKPEIGGAIGEKIKRLAEATALAYRTKAEVSYRIGVSPTVNDPELAALTREVCVNEFGEQSVVSFPPVMGSEDFSCFAARVPGMFVGVGCGNQTKGVIHPNHHPQFDIDEDALDSAAKLYVAFAKAYLARE